MATAIRPIERVEKMSVPHEVTLELYRRMLTVFYVEERIKTFVKQGKVTFHASTRGHEKMQVGMSLLLRPGHDWFFPYYRSKALAIGLGMPLEDIFLQMLGREGDPSGNGRNMPEHFSSKKLHLVGRSAVTGSQFLEAVGMARAIRASGGDAVVHVSSGEGATSEGEFFESLNWASREQLPVVFLIQNNGYAISTPQQCQTRTEIHHIAAGFGIESHAIDGTWFEDLYEIVPPAVERMRRGGGPLLVEARVVRLDPHSSSDDQRKYRGAHELEALHPLDPVLQTEAYLLRHGVIGETDVEEMRNSIRAEVDRAAEFADARPQPSGQDLMAHIYATDSVLSGPTPTPDYLPGAEVAMIDAINHGLREELERNPKLVMWGQDIADPKGGVFGVTRGLSTDFPGRVFNAPLAEASIAGVAAGMALDGYKPIVEMQFGDYLWPAALQLRNEIPTFRWRSQGEYSCPVVVRVAVGGYIKGGPWHSANVENFFTHIPGWYVAYPSNAGDAKGLIKMAARAQDPVMFLEHKGLYRKVQARTLEPGADYVLPFGRASVKREGTDATIVTWGSTVYLALELARRMEKEGVSLEVLDLRTLIPLDEETIYRSIRKTSRVLIAHEDTLTMGFGAEISARIAENAIGSLDSPVVRVAAKDSFVPSASNLELMVLPSVESLREGLDRVLNW